MIKSTLSYKHKLLEQMVFCHGIRACGSKFELCVHSTSHLKIKFQVWTPHIEKNLGPHMRPILLRQVVVFINVCPLCNFQTISGIRVL